MIEMIVDLSMNAREFLERCRAFEPLHRTFSPFEMASANSHICCSIDRRIIADLRHQLP